MSLRMGGGRYGTGCERACLTAPSTRANEVKILEDRHALRVAYVEIVGNRTIGKFQIEKIKLAGVGETPLDFSLSLPTWQGRTRTDGELLGARVNIKLQYTHRLRPHPITGSLVKVVSAKIDR